MGGSLRGSREERRDAQEVREEHANSVSMYLLPFLVLEISSVKQSPFNSNLSLFYYRYCLCVYLFLTIGILILHRKKLCVCVLLE